MNSKERVNAVLANEIPDKVPWGEWAVDFDTVEKVIGRKSFYRAKARSAMALWEGRRDEVVQSWREDGIEFFKKMDCFDIINISAMASSVAPPKDYEHEMPKKLDDTTFEFSDGTIYKLSDVTADVTKVYDPNVGKKQYTPADFEDEPLVEPPDESCFEVIDAYIDAFSEDRFLMGPSGSEVGILIIDGTFEEGGGAFTHGLMQYLDNPEMVKAAIEYEVSRANMLDRYYIRPCQDAVGWGQDFSSTQGPFISPEMFREFVLPGITSRVKNIHDRFNIPVMKHACGNNNKIIDMFAEAGYDSYQSIQTTADMKLKQVKADYGSHFAAWGGVSVENIVSGTTSDVENDVINAMENYKPGGRYIFGSTHSICVGTKYDNFMTMVDEFEKWRDY
ncbi:uroporphyrinogen decarboxylase family protein [Candidatus Latescibacterota bacterium]